MGAEADPFVSVPNRHRRAQKNARRRFDEAGSSGRFLRPRGSPRRRAQTAAVTKSVSVMSTRRAPASETDDEERRRRNTQCGS